jgi:ElaB/YqjD/DUF883 family membrane-anchored ribosome-binding protein
MVNNGQHEPMSEQLTKLETAIEDAGKEGGEKAAAIAEKGRQILALGRELAHDIAEVTSETMSSRARRAYRRAREIAEYDVEVARETVRSHPLASVAGVAAISAVVASLVTAACMSSSRRHYF